MVKMKIGIRVCHMTPDVRSDLGRQMSLNNSTAIKNSVYFTINIRRETVLK